MLILIYPISHAASNTSAITIDQFFGYTATTRIPYYFIQMHSTHLVIVNATPNAALTVRTKYNIKQIPQNKRAINKR